MICYATLVTKLLYFISMILYVMYVMPISLSYGFVSYLEIGIECVSIRKTNNLWQVSKKMVSEG